MAASAGIIERETFSRTVKGKTLRAPTKRYMLTSAHQSGAASIEEAVSLGAEIVEGEVAF